MSGIYAKRLMYFTHLILRAIWISVFGLFGCCQDTVDWMAEKQEVLVSCVLGNAV